MNKCVAEIKSVSQEELKSWQIAWNIVVSCWRQKSSSASCYGIGQDVAHPVDGLRTDESDFNKRLNVLSICYLL